MPAWCSEEFAISSSAALRIVHSTAHARIVMSAVSAKQIRAIFACALNRLFFAPLHDLCVISGKQNLRNFPATKLGRPRVLRGFQFRAFVAEAIVCSGSVLTKDARQQPH